MGLSALMPDSQSSVRPIQFGLFEVDLRAGELRKKGIRVRIQSLPFPLLVTLLQKQCEVVTREELRLTLWPEDTFVDFDHSLGTAINKLREALGDSASNPRFIETLPRRGYRFIAPVDAPPTLLRRRPPNLRPSPYRPRAHYPSGGFPPCWLSCC
jgi:DNA-binding winged helix-turn-helix (wHTH) protein